MCLTYVSLVKQFKINSDGVIRNIAKQKFDAGSPPQPPTLQPPSAAGAGGNVEGSGSRQGPKLWYRWWRL